MVYVQDKTGAEDKVISVARHVPATAPINKVMRFLKRFLVETERFSTGYKGVEAQHVTSFDWHGPTEAGHGIERAARSFARSVNPCKGQRDI